MGEGELNHLAAVVDDVVDAVVLNFLFKKIQKTVLALEDALVIVQSKTCVQVAVVIQPLGDEIIVEGIGAENFLIGDELGKSSVGLVSAALVLGCQNALFEKSLEEFSVSEGFYVEP